MSEEAIKKRYIRTIKAAKKQLNPPPEKRYRIITLDGDPFHIEAIRQRKNMEYAETLKIRVVLDEIKKEDEELLRRFKLPPNFTKEIWCKKMGEQEFEIREI